MKPRDIAIEGTPVTATAEQIRALEAALGTRFPSGYREFMLMLGEGTLGGTYIRVYPPWRIERELEAWRDRVREYWFWDGVPKERVLASVILGDTLDGDELIFHACDPDDIWVLPRNSDHALRAGHGLWSALDWLCSAGVLTAPFTERRFQPHDSRSEGAA